MNYISSLPSPSWQEQPKMIAILGSTGSIGRSTLNVIRKHPQSMQVIALAGGNNISLLAEQAQEFSPSYLAVKEEKDIPTLRALLPPNYTPTILHGEEGYAHIASLTEVNTVLCAQVGASGLHGTYSAVDSGKVVALANKESLVLAGELLRKTAQRTGASILPVDSEHSAILQACNARPPACISKLILTASGGPFKGKQLSELAHVTAQEAIQHPTWKMGKKISIDSATMMNKGLEIIEAYHLFGIELSHIEALIHPQSIIHSFVEFEDATQLAQLSYPSMELAIAYALYYPIGRSVGVPSLSLLEIQSLTFEPIPSTYRCYYLAREALQHSKEMPIVVNSANEIAVEAFLEGKITFLDIPDIIEYVVEHMSIPVISSTLEDILSLDKVSRLYTQEYIHKKYKTR